jgi:hypothetical protein
MTIPADLFTAEERDLLTRHKSPDLTPRESLLQIELQTRVQVLRKPEGPEREALLEECVALYSDIMALDFNADGMSKINDVGQKGMELHLKAIAL